MKDRSWKTPRPTPRRGLSQVLNPRLIQSGTLISFPLLQGNLIKAGTNQTLSSHTNHNNHFSEEIKKDISAVVFKCFDRT